MVASTWSAYRAAAAERADVYHFHDPELIPLAIALKARRTKIIYDAHENLAIDILAKDYLPQRLRPQIARILGRIEIASSHLFDRVIAATPAIAARFDPQKTVIIQNFPLRDELPGSAGHPFQGRAPLVAYFGTISRVRGIEEAVRAMSLVPPELNARLVLAGRFYPSALQQELLGVKGAERMEFLGWLDQVGVNDLLNRAQIGLVTYHPIPSHMESQPTKLFDYMGAGLPVVASDFPHWREFVETNRCGFLVDPLEPSSIAKAISRLLADPGKAEEMGKRGLKAVAQGFSWDHEAEKLLAVYRSLSGA
jgi:glycosyltransferase involved in cell wall biosynthesis